MRTDFCFEHAFVCVFVLACDQITLIYWRRTNAAGYIYGGDVKIERLHHIVSMLKIESIEALLELLTLRFLVSVET